MFNTDIARTHKFAFFLRSRLRIVADRLPICRRDPIGKGRDEHHCGIETRERKKSTGNPTATGTDNIHSCRTRADHVFDFARANHNDFPFATIDGGHPLAVDRGWLNLLYRPQISRGLIKMANQRFVHRCRNQSTAPESHNG